MTSLNLRFLVSMSEKTHGKHGPRNQHLSCSWQLLMNVAFEMGRVIEDSTNMSGQIIATSHDQKPQKAGF